MGWVRVKLCTLFPHPKRCTQTLSSGEKVGATGCVSGAEWADTSISHPWEPRSGLQLPSVRDGSPKQGRHRTPDWLSVKTQGSFAGIEGSMHAWRADFGIEFLSIDPAYIDTKPRYQPDWTTPEHGGSTKAIARSCQARTHPVHPALRVRTVPPPKRAGDPSHEPLNHVGGASPLASPGVGGERRWCAWGFSISNTPSSGIHQPPAGRKTTRGLRRHLLAAPAAGSFFAF